MQEFHELIKNLYMALRYEVILMPKAPVPMTMKGAVSKAG